MEPTEWGWKMVMGAAIYDTTDERSSTPAILSLETQAQIVRRDKTGQNWLCLQALCDEEQGSYKYLPY